jgi:hypothetical protein
VRCSICGRSATCATTGSPNPSPSLSEPRDAVALVSDHEEDEHVVHEAGQLERAGGVIAVCVQHDIRARLRDGQLDVGRARDTVTLGDRASTAVSRCAREMRGDPLAFYAFNACGAGSP